MQHKSYKTVILIRHGKTSYNATGRYMGCGIDEDLSREGMDDITKKRDKIRSFSGEAVVFAGPLKRARHTAKLIFYDKTINIEDSLTEIDFGDFEGKTAAELSADPRYQQWIDSDGTLKFPNGECVDDFRRRTMNSLHKIISRASSSPKIAIVCHGGNIMSVMSVLCGGAYYDYLIPNVDGYIIQMTVEDERISGISYDRIGTGDTA